MFGRFTSLILFIIIFSSLNSFAFPPETGFGVLVSSVLISKSVLVDDVKTLAKGSAFSRCLRYEDDNSRDGQCLEFRSYCKFEITFPPHDQSGSDRFGFVEKFWTSDPSFFDSSLAADSYNYDCDGILKNWSKRNVGKTIDYTTDANIYQNQRWSYGPPNRVPKVKQCERNSIIREKVVSGAHQLFRVQPVVSKVMNDNDCDE